MFEQAFDSLRKATEANVQMQQELFKKWTSLWPEMPATAPWSEHTQQLQKKWSEQVAELLRRQREAMETQFGAGLRHIEEAFKLGEAKDLEELRAKTIRLWQKMFDCLRQNYEAQTRDFQNAVTKWTELVTEGAA